MTNSQEQFCALFIRTQQLADENGLKRENTVLAKDFCPYAQACLGLKCRLLKKLKKNSPYLNFHLSQNGPQPYNPQEAFFRRLEKTAQIKQLSNY